MKKYNIKLLWRIGILILFSGITGYLLSIQFYWASIFPCLAIIWASHHLFSFQKRNTKDMKRLINAIQFSEFNISFKNFSEKGLSPELISDMETSILHFNNKLKKIEAEQNFYNILLNRIDFGIIVIDKQEKISWINKSALDLFEKPQPRQLSDLEKVSSSLPKILRELLPKETKIIKIEHGKTIHQLAITSIYFTLEGKQLKLISLKNIQTVLEESESDAWKKLIRVLTHEIMNSITPIISLSETFAHPDKENQEMLIQAMQIIHRRSKGLIRFTHNYQKLSRIPNPIITSFKASELIEDITQLLQADGLSFSYHIQPLSVLLKADRGQMEQVMINLIKNAHEASSEQVRAEINVEISLNEYQRPMIKVIDKGQGILPDVLDKIFVPFFTTKKSGSGIGLSICRQIINLHGGTISVKSEVGKGSCFYISL